MASNIFPGDVLIQGALTVTNGISGSLARTGLVSEALTNVGIPLTNFRVWDAFQTLLGTAGSDDMGIGTGAFGTGLPYLVSSNADNTSITQYARALIQLPPQYVAAGAIQVRLAAGMLTSVASSSATVDVEAYLSARTTLKSGSDLVTTAAQSINSLTFAEKTFDLSTATLSPGSWLDIRLTFAATDAAVGTAVLCAIAHAELLLTTQG
jgi:hypothetical protein